jgi:hypothetical protein
MAAFASNKLTWSMAHPRSAQYSRARKKQLPISSVLVAVGLVRVNEVVESSGGATGLDQWPPPRLPFRASWQMWTSSAYSGRSLPGWGRSPRPHFFACCLRQSLPRPGSPPAPDASGLSLLGPTIRCRGRTCTCKHVKDCRLHIGNRFGGARRY